MFDIASIVFLLFRNVVQIHQLYRFGNFRGSEVRHSMTPNSCVNLRIPVRAINLNVSVYIGNASE